MGFENDKLNREKYADFLTDIVKEPNLHKRDSDSESMTIAIDSGWGTGKTTFIKMWMEKITEEYPNDFAIIGYNAWKNDFIENPFESILYAIYNSNIFDKINKTERREQAKVELLRSLGRLSLATGKFVAKKIAGDEIIEAFGDFLNEIQEGTITGTKNIINKEHAIDEESMKLYENFKEYNDAIEKLKENLREVTKSFKLIIVIDELDRCKPLFAIKLLENIKHIFDVENIIFVFALDMEQLGHSIKCIYGQEMDANGYLCRFFDYITKMPSPDRNTYIDYLINKKPLKLTKISDSISGEKNVDFKDLFCNVSDSFKLSLRDINTIYANFIVLESQELKNVNNIKAYSLYLILLCIKYKHMDIFNDIFIRHQFSITNSNLYQILKEIKYFDEKTITVLNRNNRIEDREWIFTINSSRNLSIKISTVNNRIVYENIDSFDSISRYPKSYEISINTNASDLLFYNDLMNWEEIKNKRIGDYIQEKLEFFNFEFEKEIKS